MPKGVGYKSNKKTRRLAEKLEPGGRITDRDLQIADQIQGGRKKKRKAKKKGRKTK